MEQKEQSNQSLEEGSSLKLESLTDLDHLSETPMKIKLVKKVIQWKRKDHLLKNRNLINLTFISLNSSLLNRNVNPSACLALAQLTKSILGMVGKLTQWHGEFDASECDVWQVIMRHT